MELVPETIEEHSVTQSSVNKAAIRHRKRTGEETRRQTGVFNRGTRKRSTHQAIGSGKFKPENFARVSSLKKDNKNPNFGKKNKSAERRKSLDRPDLIPNGIQEKNEVIHDLHVNHEQNQSRTMENSRISSIARIERLDS